MVVKTISYSSESDMNQLDDRQKKKNQQIFNFALKEVEVLKALKSFA